MSEQPENVEPVDDAPGTGQEADDVTTVQPDADPSEAPDETDPNTVVPAQPDAVNPAE